MNTTNNMFHEPSEILMTLARNIENLNKVLRRAWGELPEEIVDNVLLSRELEDKLKNDPQIKQHEHHQMPEGFMARIYSLPYKSSILSPPGGAILCNFKGVPLYIIGSDGELRKVPKGISQASLWPDKIDWRY